MSRQTAFVSEYFTADKFRELISNKSIKSDFYYDNKNYISDKEFILQKLELDKLDEKSLEDIDRAIIENLKVGRNNFYIRSLDNINEEETLKRFPEESYSKNYLICNNRCCSPELIKYKRLKRNEKYIGIDMVWCLRIEQYIPSKQESFPLDYLIYINLDFKNKLIVSRGRDHSNIKWKDLKSIDKIHSRLFQDYIRKNIISSSLEDKDFTYKKVLYNILKPYIKRPKGIDDIINNEYNSYFSESVEKWMSGFENEVGKDIKDEFINDKKILLEKYIATQKKYYKIFEEAEKGYPTKIYIEGSKNSSTDTRSEHKSLLSTKDFYSSKNLLVKNKMVNGIILMCRDWNEKIDQYKKFKVRYDVNSNYLFLKTYGLLDSDKINIIKNDVIRGFTSLNERAYSL